MKNSLVFFSAIFMIAVLSSCNTEESIKESSCHTELVPTELSSSVVADAEVIHTGQSISGVVKDHAKKVKGYTKDMFLADNPHIAERKPFTKLDPCDSTKVKYVSIPLHSGDTVYLRYPYRIDTIPGDGHSIVWENTPGRKVSAEQLKTGIWSIRLHRIIHVIDMDDEGRFVVSEQDISCKGNNDLEIKPIPSKPRVGQDDSSLWSNFVGWWAGFFSVIPPSWILGFLICLFFTFWIWKVGRQTQRVVRDCHDTTRGLNEVEHGTTRNLVVAEHKTTRSGFSEVVLATKEHTDAVKEQVAETKQTNDLLQKILEQGGLSGRKTSKRKSSSSPNSGSKS